MNNYELIKFRDKDFELDVSVSPEEDTVWLTNEQISLLFDLDRTVISRHINNIYKEDELEKESTCAKNAHMASNRLYYINYYNLDVIISVGYRVKSKRGILFRKWATNVLKQYLLKGYVVDNNRVTISKDNFVKLENDVQNIKKEIKNIKEKVFIEPVKEKLFFNGEYFDAYEFICSLVESATKSILIIDPYLDVHGLKIFKKVPQGVLKTICISSKSKIKQEDVDLFKKQFGEINIKMNDSIHDRFLILDANVCYSLGTSLNYMGKRVFSILKVESKCIIDALIHAQK